MTYQHQINGTRIGVYLPISKLHSILAVANLLAHNNLWLCYYEQVNSVRLKSSVASKWESKKPLRVTFILLLMVLQASNPNFHIKLSTSYPHFHNIPTSYPQFSKYTCNFLNSHFNIKKQSPTIILISKKNLITITPNKSMSSEGWLSQYKSIYCQI